MRELADPLVTLLWTYQAQANHSGKEVTIPWADINTVILQKDLSPAINYDTFDQQYTGEQSQSLGALNNIVNGNRDSYDKNGIRLVPDNKPVAPTAGQPIIDASHSTVASTAMHQLKSQS